MVAALTPSGTRSRFLQAVALGTWFTANALITLMALSYAEPNLLNGSVTYPSLADVYEMLRSHNAPTLPAQWFVTTALVWLACTFMLWLLFEACTRTLARTPLRHAAMVAGPALVWSLKAFLSSGMFVLVLIPTLLLVAVTARYDDTQILPIVALVQVVLLLPTMLLNRPFLSAATPRPRQLKWPGLVRVLFFSVALVLGWTVDLLLTLMPPMPVLGIGIAWYLLWNVLLAVAIGLLIDTLPLARFWAELRRRCRLRFVLAWPVVDAVSIVPALWLAAPLIVVNIVAIYVLPQWEVTRVYTGAVATNGERLIIDTIEFLASFGYIVMIAPMVALMTLIRARFLVLLDTAEAP